MVKYEYTFSVRILQFLIELKVWVKTQFFQLFPLHFCQKLLLKKNGLLNPVDYCSLGIHPTLSTKTYYTVKTYVWKKKFKQIIIVLKNCHNIRSTTIYTNVTTFSFSLFLLSMAFLFSALFLYFSPFFSSFFAQSILVTLLVKKRNACLFECVFRKVNFRRPQHWWWC